MEDGMTLRRDEPPPEEVRNAAADSARQFGKFIRLEQVGRGGWGEVWRAWETGLGRFVAIKTLLGSVEAEDRERFLREARMAAKLAHPNIVAIHEQGRIDGIDYISMHFVAGQPLSKLRLPLREGLAVMRDAARAVEAAHQQGLVHRDLKPANIMVEEKTGRAYVLDFGLARSVRGGTSLSVSGTIMGTPAYMAPEQAEGHVHVDARADVYGLGATLYEVVTGQPPFAGESILDVLRKVQSEEPAPLRRLNPRLGADVETITLKAMEKEAARRYRSAAEFADDIDRYLKDDMILARPASLTYRIYRRVRKQPVAFALAALLVIAIAAGAAFGAVRLARQMEAERSKAREERRGRLVEQAAVAVLESDDQLPDPRVPLAEIQSRLRQVIENLESGVKEFGEDGRMLYWLARAHDQLWEDGAARDLYDRAIRVDDPDGRAHFHRGKLTMRRFLGTLYEEGEETRSTLATLWKQADADFEVANRRLPLGSERALADAYMKLVRGSAEDLAKFCQARIDEGGRVEEFHFVLALRLLDKERWAEALLHLEATVRANPRHVHALFGRGMARGELKDEQGEIDDCTAAIALNPYFEAAFVNRGIAHARLKNFRAAVADYDRAIALRPDDPAPLYSRANAKREMGDFKGAIEDYTKAIEHTPNQRHAGAFLNRAWTRGRLGDFRGRIEDSTKAIEIDPQLAGAYNNRGLGKVEAGDPEGALPDFTEAIKKAPDYVEALRNRGAAFHALGRWAEALADFKKAVDLKPELERKLRKRILECEQKLKKPDDY